MLSSQITVVKESIVSSISLVTGSRSVHLFLFMAEKRKEKKQANQRSRKLKLTAERNLTASEDDSVAKADESGMFPSMLKQKLFGLF